MTRSSVRVREDKRRNEKVKTRIFEGKWWGLSRDKCHHFSNEMFYWLPTYRNILSNYTIQEKETLTSIVVPIIVKKKIDEGFENCNSFSRQRCLEREKKRKEKKRKEKKRKEKKRKEKEEVGGIYAYHDRCRNTKKKVRPESAGFIHKPLNMVFERTLQQLKLLS